MNEPCLIVKNAESAEIRGMLIFVPTEIEDWAIVGSKNLTVKDCEIWTFVPRWWHFCEWYRLIRSIHRYTGTKVRPFEIRHQPKEPPCTP